MRMTPGAHWRFVAIVVLVSAGCGSVAPSPRLSAGPSPVPTPAIAATSAPTVVESPTPSRAPVSTLAARAELTDLSVETHRVPAALTGHISAYVSFGDQIVWSGGPADVDNDLYRLDTGVGQAELLFENQERDSIVTSICGSAAGYLFTDERWDGGEPRGWRLWFMPTPGMDPILVDQSSDDKLIAPTIAMDDTWIAWEVVHGTYDDPLNELRVARVADPTAATTLLSYPGRDVYMQFPSLWDDELWYGIADNDWEAITERPRVEMIDLAQPDAPPVAFGAEQRAFMPAAGRDVVAWKSGGSAEMSGLNSGVLTLYWRATRQVEPLPVPGSEIGAERISYPSVGNRFVAWWDDIQHRLYVYDLAERQFRRLAEYDATTDEHVTKPSLSGDLLVYTHYLSDEERYLEWALLPR